MLASTLVAAAQESPVNLIRYVPGTAQRSPEATHARPVRIDTSVLAAGSRRFRLELPDGPAFEVERDDLERRGEDNVTWRGRLRGEPASRVVLTMKNGYVSGAIRSRQGLYEIKPQAGGQHVFEKLNPECFPQCGGGVLPPDLFDRTNDPQQDTAPFAAATAADSANDIHLMSL